jgi:hypothetical protein
MVTVEEETEDLTLIEDLEPKIVPDDPSMIVEP